MALTPGLSPSLRLVDPEKDETIHAGDTDIVVEDADEGSDTPEYDEKGNVLSIEHPDGSITVSLDGRPGEDAANDGSPEGWFDNLVDKIDDMELGRIAADLLRGVAEDISSRSAWVAERASGLRLLGLQVELPGVQGTAEGAPVEGMSRVRHPLGQHGRPTRVTVTSKEVRVTSTLTLCYVYTYAAPPPMLTLGINSCHCHDVHMRSRGATSAHNDAGVLRNYLHADTTCCRCPDIYDQGPVS